MTPHELPLIDEADWSRLGAEVGDAAVPRLLRLYSVELRALVDALASAQQSGSPEDLKVHTHKAKNSAALFGAVRLASQCRELDEQLGGGRYLPTDVAAALDTAEATLAALEEHLSPTATTTEGTQQ